MLSSARGSLRVITLADGGPRLLTRADLLYVRSEPVPLFVHFLQAFFSFLPWLHRALSCGVLLLMRRLHLFVLRLFITCEDFRLRSAPDITFSALSEFTAESWQALLHLSTSPVPQVGKVDPQLVERGLGAVGSYTISDDLWCELLNCFGALSSVIYCSVTQCLCLGFEPVPRSSTTAGGSANERVPTTILGPSQRLGDYLMGRR